MEPHVESLIFTLGFSFLMDALMLCTFRQRPLTIEQMSQAVSDAFGDDLGAVLPVVLLLFGFCCFLDMV